MNLLQLEDALAALKLAELEKVEAARQSTLSRLASGLAHELRNPLNIIQGIAETVDEDPKQGSSDDSPTLGTGVCSVRWRGSKISEIGGYYRDKWKLSIDGRNNRMSDIT